MLAGRQRILFILFSFNYKVNFPSSALTLSAFLFDSDFLAVSNKPSLSACFNSARLFKCSCGHSGKKLATAKPPFPTFEDFERAKNEKTQIARPSAVRRVFQTPSQTLTGTPPASTSPSASFASVSASYAPPTVKKTAPDARMTIGDIQKCWGVEEMLNDNPSPEIPLEVELSNGSQLGSPVIINKEATIDDLHVDSGSATETVIDAALVTPCQWHEWKGKVAKGEWTVEYPLTEIPAVDMKSNTLYDTLFTVPRNRSLDNLPIKSPKKRQPKKASTQTTPSPQVVKPQETSKIVTPKAKKTPKIQPPPKKLPTTLFEISLKQKELTYQQKTNPEFVAKKQQFEIIRQLKAHSTPQAPKQQPISATGFAQLQLEAQTTCFSKENLWVAALDTKCTHYTKPRGNNSEYDSIFALMEKEVDVEKKKEKEKSVAVDAWSMMFGSESTASLTKKKELKALPSVEKKGEKVEVNVEEKDNFEEKLEEKVEEKVEEKIDEKVEEKAEEKTRAKIEKVEEEKFEKKVEEKTEEKTEEETREETEEKTEERVEEKIEKNDVINEKIEKEEGNVNELEFEAEGDVVVGSLEGGLLSLPFETIHSIVLSVSMCDVRNITLTCKHLNRVVEDGLLWRQLFSKHYPASQFTAANISGKFISPIQTAICTFFFGRTILTGTLDWKYLFQMEVGRIFETLKCFHTKASFDEGVLGLPLQITMNPRLGAVDYIFPDMDFLSADAFFNVCRFSVQVSPSQDKIRKTVWNESFTHWIPLYINQAHFDSSLSFLQRSVVKLCPDWETRNFSPYMICDVIPKIMNTMVVLLSDKGIHASEKALSVFCSLHRLFIALVKEYPELQEYIDYKVKQFCTDEEKRHKKEMPNLGHFLPLLCVSSIPWRKVIPIVLSEMLDRNFIWVAKKYPNLANGLNNKNKKADMDRIAKTFEASTVSLRLFMFHVQFLRRFRRVSSLDAIAFDYDRYYGFPSYKDLTGFQKTVGQILSVSGWCSFYKVCELKHPSAADMTKLLINAVKNSRKKNYHNDRTDFSRIHASGVSKILLKGESYTCNTNLNTVKLEEIWQFPDGKTKYLDASCLVYKFGSSACAEHVDYSRTRDTSGAIVHSGDVMDRTKNQGKHVITVSLKKLPRDVRALYFTITAFHTTLTDILHPEILFLDPESDQQLCSYQFGDNKNTGSNTAVIMAKMERKSETAQWEVKAIGHIGMGMAGNYSPIHEDINKSKL